MLQYQSPMRLSVKTRMFCFGIKPFFNVFEFGFMSRIVSARCGPNKKTQQRLSKVRLISDEVIRKFSRRHKLAPMYGRLWENVVAFGLP